MARLSTEERIEAEILAAHLLCRRAREYDVRKHLRETFAVTYKVAIAIVAKVRKEQKAAALAAREEMLRDSYSTLDEATALAFKNKDVRAVVLCERLRAELGGLIGGDQHAPPPTDGDHDHFPGRSESELDHFAVHGSWPTEVQSKSN